MLILLTKLNYDVVCKGSSSSFGVYFLTCFSSASVHYVFASLAFASLTHSYILYLFLQHFLFLSCLLLLLPSVFLLTRFFSHSVFIFLRWFMHHSPPIPLLLFSVFLLSFFHLSSWFSLSCHLPLSLSLQITQSSPLLPRLTFSLHLSPPVLLLLNLLFLIYSLLLSRCFSLQQAIIPAMLMFLPSL